MTSPHTSFPSPPVYCGSEAEAMFYYSGLPSNPKLVYRLGRTPWIRPTGPEAQRVLKELRPVFGHKLNTIWKDLGPKVCNFLDSAKIWWTTIDIVRFAYGEREREAVSPVVLWIGVLPVTLFGDSAHTAASGCLCLLWEFGITDVEVEFQESIYTQPAGPGLLEHISDSHPTVDVCGPLTPALGLSIAAQATPHIEGTGGLYFAEGGDSKKIFLITACHLLFPLNETVNINYTYTNPSAPRCNVLLLGTKGFNNFTESIITAIRQHGLMDSLYNGEIEELQGLIEKFEGEKGW